jgi:cytosine/adenosine deaminase-related metal-dependent hydrolase
VDHVSHGTRVADPAPETEAGPRPVILATFSVRIDPNAERMAFESAREVGARLIVANLMMLPPYPTTLMLAREYVTLPHEEDLEAVRATAARAGALGIGTELLRITSRRPLAALVELISERRASLVVLGPDVRRAPRWQVRLAARRVRRQTDCLIWVAPDGVL